MQTRNQIDGRCQWSDAIGRQRTVADYVLMDYFSPAAITDEEGAITERYAFSAFGLRSIFAPDYSPRTSSESAFEFSFQGQFQDSATGWLNYGYRYYIPALGRWPSKDPIGESGGANLYGMVNNNPLGQVDLLGLAIECTASGTCVSGIQNRVCPRQGNAVSGTARRSTVSLATTAAENIAKQACQTALESPGGGSNNCTNCAFKSSKVDCKEVPDEK